MIAGFLVLGVAAGMVSGGTALIMGNPLWLSGLAYAFGGAMGLGLGVSLASMTDRGEQH